MQSMSKVNGCGLFVYRIYDVFYINLRKYSMHSYCYIFLFRFIY